jgi:hypothetical protein
MPKNGKNLLSLLTLDLRSLAAFRIGLGALILLDLVQRYADLTAFYTDKGVLPISLLTLGQPGNWQWSIHAWSGTAEFQMALFAVAAIAGFCLLIGCFTTTASLVSWLLLISIHTRNPLVGNAGDSYLALLTFWGMFLPLGRVWSFDARKLPPPSEMKISSLPTAALYLQVLYLYVSTAVLKLQNESWQSGEAIAISLSKDYLITLSGRALSTQTLFLKWLTWATLVFEVIGPIAVVFSRGWTRLGVLALFAVFHLGLAICFSIGLFPYVCIVALLAFLPAEIWGRASTAALTSASQVIPDVQPGWTRYAQGFSRIVLLLAMTVSAWSFLNGVIPAIGMPTGVRQFSRAFHLSQKWQMFVNPAANRDGWIVFDARFVDGSSCDLLTGVSPVSSDRPELVSATFKNFRWRKLCINLLKERFKVVRTGLGVYLLLERDRIHHDVDRLKSLEISFVSPSEPRKTLLFDWRNTALKYHDAIIREE